VASEEHWALARVTPIPVVRVQDVGLAGLSDEDVLRWAAAEQRVLLTHDVTTITDCAYRRVLVGEPMPGVFEVVLGSALGTVINDLVLIDECSVEGEWEGRVAYLPFRART